MGVQNFWQLIEATGRPVNMNKGLEGKVLAIDISIWLHQAAKGMRDRQNPHIILLLHRICKLLHFKIKPIFIFDGGVPELKRRTLCLFVFSAERRQRREVAAIKIKEANSKIRTNYLKMLAIQQLRGEEIQSLPPAPCDEREKDIFELPDTDIYEQLAYDENEGEEDDDAEIIENTELQPVTKVKRQRTIWSKTQADNDANDHYLLPNVNEMDDDALSNLPVEMQHEILTNLKERLKRGRKQIEDMPQKSDDFSDYQVQKLLKQNTVSQKIVELNKAIKRQKFDIPLESNTKVYAGKLASDSCTQYILIKPDTTQKSEPATNLSRISSSTSFSRQSTSDFCVNTLMDRDPVTTHVQQQNTTVDIGFLIEKDDFKSSSLEEEQIVTIDKPIEKEKKTSPINEPTVENSSIREYDEEAIALEIAIKRSLEDQQRSISENNNDDLSNTIESSSDSDDSDFIDVPTIPKSTEPIILPHFIGGDDDESNDISKTNTNQSSEFIELDNDENESSNNSTAIEDITMFIDNNKDQSLLADFDSSQPSIYQSERLDELQAELVNDIAVQLTAARGNERLTMTLTDTMHEDTQYLLRLFGIPYLVSPTEAEAQCAYLDLTNQCDGVITDDSDVWLFGASHVYRHFFRQEQLVEHYDSTIIANQLGLDRESMIAIGMIVGSDYTNGIPNAGIMTALEILQEFHGTCMERLEKFRHWWKKAQKPDYKTQSKVLKRLKNLALFEGFPNQAIYDAYISPKVDPDKSKFTWAMPQLELIREFIGSKLKWDRRKIDDMILPVIKRMNTNEIQSRIDCFFAPVLFESTSHQFKKNTRLKSALDLLKQKTQKAKENENENDLNLSEDDNTPIPERNAPKRKKRPKTTKLMNNLLDSVQKTKQRSKKKKPIVSPILSDEENV
ncbi:unnamed protein product [Rotaria socialis]|uniref:Uncharacterized protein n=1 Tax=Rotaria socialis TaxID=392032 RepID=A0A817Q9U9_9BILA|nr:unnamed protein product [Rotaria socialis]CAF4158978.1 unnamed protein product [Rotaria socialis]